MLSYCFRSPNHPKFDPTIEPGLLSNTLGALGAYPRPWHARPTRMSVGPWFWFQRWLQLPALACLLSVRHAPQWTPSSSGVQRTSACIQEGSKANAEFLTTSSNVANVSLQQSRQKNRGPRPKEQRTTTGFDRREAGVDY